MTKLKPLTNPASHQEAIEAAEVLLEMVTAGEIDGFYAIAVASDDSVTHFNASIRRLCVHRLLGLLVHSIMEITQRELVE